MESAAAASFGAYMPSLRKWSVLLIALAGVCLLLPLRAQESTGGVIPSRFRTFRIPFNVGTGGGQIRQVQLYVSTDQGRTWQPSATAPPEQGFFRFVAERDGQYWFAVQTLDLDNRVSPPNMQGAQPSLKVMVDTAAPAVQLQPLPPRANEVGVSWDVRDDNLEYLPNDTVRLEYRPAGGLTWVPLNIPVGAAQLYWNPQTPGAVEVRLQARDRAGNTTQATANVGLGNNAANPNPGAANPGAANPGGFNFAPNLSANPDGPGQNIANPPAEHERKLVGSKRITLNYELKEVGPSGVAAVDLWYTTNGRTWNKYPYKFDNPEGSSVSFDVEGEGVYGITLVAKSGVGLSERAPQNGDRPQIWIEVDLTKPAVQLQNVLVGTGADKGKLSINWVARDKNLARDCITLSYAEQPTGPWKTLAEKAPNTSRYVWTMPEGVPYQFHVRVEAVDQAGNVGEAVTESLVKVDLALPKVRILNVEPGR